MLLIVGTFCLPPAPIEQARRAMRRMIEASRAEDGCLSYDYAQDVLDPGLIHVKEAWRDQAALDRHVASDHIGRWRAAWPSLGIGSRALVAYDVAEARPV